MGRNLLVDGKEVGEVAVAREAMRRALRAANWVRDNPSYQWEVLLKICEVSPEAFVEAVEETKGGKPPIPGGFILTPSQRQEVEREIRENKKIQAIKLFREFTKSGLREAKDAVEEMARQLDFNFR